MKMKAAKIMAHATGVFYALIGTYYSYVLLSLFRGPFGDLGVEIPWTLGLVVIVPFGIAVVSFVWAHRLRNTAQSSEQKPHALLVSITLLFGPILLYVAYALFVSYFVVGPIWDMVEEIG